MSDFMLEVDPDDWWERTQENPPDPLEEIRQLHERFLAELEGLAVEAIATNNWDGLFAHIASFRKVEASTKSLTRSGAGSFSQTELTFDKD